MDDLDCALLEAWNRLAATLRTDRAEAEARARRRLSAAFRRPIRPWCLALRSADTRLGLHAAIAPACPDIEGCPPEAPSDPDVRAEFLVLSGAGVRALTKPVILDWPGIDWRKAARRLGRHHCCMQAWMRSGRVRVSRYNARSVGKRGSPVPFVWSPGPLDPGADLFEAPDPIWGTLWQSRHLRVPEDAEFTLLRAPIAMYDPRGARGRGSMREHGYRWVCRGLPGRPCGRMVEKLFIPLPVFSLVEAMGDDPVGDVAFELPGVGSAGDASPAGRVGKGLPVLSGLAGEGVPGAPALMDSSSTAALAWPRAEAGPRGAMRAACKRCHGVRYCSLADENGWNVFVTHITAGLLYGREVARPAWVRSVRKREYRARRRDRSRDVVVGGVLHTPRQAEILRALLSGTSPARIAATLGIVEGSVQNHIYRVCRLHGVRGRGALLARFGVERALPPRMAEIAVFLRRGLGTREIARRMGITEAGVHSQVGALRRRLGAATRLDLVAALRERSIRMPERGRGRREAA